MDKAVQSLDKISPAFGQSFCELWPRLLVKNIGTNFCRFRQPKEISFSKFALIQTGLSNFALAKIFERTLIGTTSNGVINASIQLIVLANRNFLPP